MMRSNPKLLLNYMFNDALDIVRNTKTLERIFVEKNYITPGTINVFLYLIVKWF